MVAPLVTASTASRSFTVCWASSTSPWFQNVPISSHPNTGWRLRGGHNMGQQPWNPVIASEQDVAKPLGWLRRST